MIIPCFRCGKGIESADNTNADYVLADDMIAEEVREQLTVVKNNAVTREKLAQIATSAPETGKRMYPDVVITEDDYDRERIRDMKAAYTISRDDLIRVEASMGEEDVQKTGVICPDCYLPMDTVIWGIHKSA